MTSANDIIDTHIGQGRDRVDYACQQLLAAGDADRPVWLMQIQADRAALDAIVRFQRDAVGHTDPAALAEQRREELRLTAEATDLARNHGAHTRGERGGIAGEALVLRALAPFTAMANLHSDLWQASRNAA
ncbi:hypothetical protein P3T35_003051 [Kitasatospora sp. GP30]|uniref:hypothetical protein n=1 Tax=Kitasatospora sp. GP30 TaxID=3035084 RepID=UPI000C703FF2|nr:hypothetical protein [Kitasatospora sp. GP30]MDH6141038.1 hypothetical protein [Kitasatospora sp. GP30]